MTNTNKWGAVAEFDSAQSIYHAAEKLTAEGYTRTDAHTPFPIHGIDKVLHHKESGLGWIVVCGGFTGGAVEVDGNVSSQFLTALLINAPTKPPRHIISHT